MLLSRSIFLYNVGVRPSLRFLDPPPTMTTYFPLRPHDQHIHVLHMRSMYKNRSLGNYLMLLSRSILLYNVVI